MKLKILESAIEDLHRGRGFYARHGEGVGRPILIEPLMRTCSSSPKRAATGLEVRFRTSTLACLLADAAGVEVFPTWPVQQTLETAADL